MRLHKVQCDVCRIEQELDYDKDSYPHYFSLPKGWHVVSIDTPAVQIDADVCSSKCGSIILEKAVERSRA